MKSKRILFEFDQRALDMLPEGLLLLKVPA